MTFLVLITLLIIEIYSSFGTRTIIVTHKVIKETKPIHIKDTRRLLNNGREMKFKINTTLAEIIKGNNIPLMYNELLFLTFKNF